ncbi:uncharacterized protein LOC125667001 isoform X2 [Ostrea edulis]|uniref:uncharacterized protein LOC125667001 isoform X2 n=1 Tax=Ostrea edulis TaxID=37623 RepID=UPI0024AEA7B5|nr:uncharacterized protein LOC125667001 isoform X2 [Ostrea edulis]
MAVGNTTSQNCTDLGLMTGVTGRQEKFAPLTHLVPSLVYPGIYGTLTTMKLFFYHKLLIYSLGRGPDERLPIQLSPAIHGMLEVNFEAVPQLLLQIYINVNTLACDENDIKTRLLRYVAVGGSAFDIIVAMYVYKNYVAERLSSSEEIEFKVKFASFLKKLFLIGARLVIFALFLSEFTDWFYMFAGYRFLICVILSFIKLCFRIETRAEEDVSFIKRSLISIIDAFLNLFIVVKFSDYKGSYLPLKCASYIFIYCENIVLFTIWILLTQYNDTWYYWPSIGLIVAFSVCNVLCELLYFKCKHKNRVGNDENPGNRQSKHWPFSP